MNWRLNDMSRKLKQEMKGNRYHMLLLYLRNFPCSGCNPRISVQSSLVVCRSSSAPYVPLPLPAGGAATRVGNGTSNDGGRRPTRVTRYGPTQEAGRKLVLRVLLSGRWLPRNQGWLNFWETRVVTVRKSLHRSCWTELTCQGILLP